MRAPVHSRAQCHEKWSRGSRKFQHPTEIKPLSPSNFDSTSSQSHKCVLMCTYRQISQKSRRRRGVDVDQFFACWILIYGLPKSNIEVRQDTPIIFTEKFWSTHIIMFGWFEQRLELKLEYQCSSRRLSTLAQWENKTWNSGQMVTDLRELDVIGWSGTSDWWIAEAAG